MFGLVSGLGSNNTPYLMGVGFPVLGLLVIWLSYHFSKNLTSEKRIALLIILGLLAFALTYPLVELANYLDITAMPVT